MSADDSQQVSLSPSSSRAPRNLGAPVSISKAARQVVPAFLQKLYEMVNDPKNDELIRWSDAGDSFFVLDHERFAHEVLGRWFKHRNFSSFVRQLNMYGFHKIPHLQQGVLKSDNETEFWNFAHQSFHRGQPDLLCLIQRKKQATQGGEEDAPPGVGGQQGVFGTQPGMFGAVSSQALDFHSIVNGISAIKRHQTTISAELIELKRSNQLLWQDAMAARTRHQQQQDTINRIVKFLAGVFGHHADKKRREAEGNRERGVGEGDGRGGAVERGRGRGGRGRPLMIEDVRRDKGKGVIRIITEPSEDPATKDADDNNLDEEEEEEGVDEELDEDEDNDEEQENPSSATPFGELYGHNVASHPPPSQPAVYPAPPIERPSTIEHPPSPSAMSNASASTRIGDPRESITITPYYPSPGIAPGSIPVGAPLPRSAGHMPPGTIPATAVSTPMMMMNPPGSVAATSPMMAQMMNPPSMMQTTVPNPATTGPMEVMQPPDSINSATQVPVYPQYAQPMQAIRGRQSIHHGQAHMQMQQQPRSNTPSPHPSYSGHTATSPAGSARASSPPPTYDWDPRVRSVLNQLTAGQVQHLLKSLHSGANADQQGGQTYGPNPYEYPPYPVGPSSSYATHPVETGAYGYEHYPYPPGYTSPLGAGGTTYHQQQPQHMNPTPMNPTPSSIASALGGPSAMPASSSVMGGAGIPGIPGSENLIPLDDDQDGSDTSENTRIWRATTDIDKDVNALNSSINQLIETFGLDSGMIVEEDLGFGLSPPPLRVPPPESSSSSELASALSSTGAGATMHPVGPGPGDGGTGGRHSDFDLHSFLSTLPSANAAVHSAEYADIAAAASEFLGGALSASTSPVLPAAAPIFAGLSGVGRGASPEVSLGAGVQSRAGRKRKSDAVLASDMEGVQSIGGGSAAPSVVVTRPAGKAKRRKDKTR